MSWKQLMAFAHDKAYFVCSLCEKNTARNDVHTRPHPNNKTDNPFADKWRWQWQCSNCKAWHESEDDFYKPELIQI